MLASDDIDGRNRHEGRVADEEGRLPASVPDRRREIALDYAVRWAGSDQDASQVVDAAELFMAFLSGPGPVGFGSAPQRSPDPA